MLLVYFSAEWCGYCRRLTPEYHKAAAILRQEGSDVPFVMMESSDYNRELFDKFKVNRYPTVMLINNGLPSTVYGGEYDAESIAQFVRSSTGDAITTVSSMEELEEKLQATRDNSHYSLDAKCVVGASVVAASEGVESATLAVFSKAARTRGSGGRYGPFFLSQGNNDLFKNLLSKHIQEKQQGDPSGFFIIIISLDEKAPIAIEKMHNDSAADDVLRYIDSFHLPIILKYQESNLKRIQWFARGIQVLVFSPSSNDDNAYIQRWPDWLSSDTAADTSSAISPWDKAGDLFLGVVSQVADKYRGRALFIHVPEFEYHIYQLFHVSRKEGFNPEIILLDLRDSGQMKRYQLSKYEQYANIMDDAMSEIVEGLNSDRDMAKALSQETKMTKVDQFRKQFSTFINLFSKGKLEATIISEEAIEPALNAANKIVGKNFVQEVSDPDVDVYIVAFLAPWCGHSKALEPVLDSLARYFQPSSAQSGVPVVKIGSMDATKNEVFFPGVKIYGYPTIYMFVKQFDDKVAQVCRSVVDEEIRGEQLCPAGEYDTLRSNIQSSVKAIEYDGQRTVRELKKAIRLLSSQ